MLLHYLGKLKNQKFALYMHVTHVSSVIFYHLSNRYLPNVMKIRAKINSMQNINILLFVRLLSLTNWRKAMARCPIGHHWHCNWPVQKASPGMSVQMVDIWTPLVDKLLQTIGIFHVFSLFVSSGFCPSCQSYCVDAWWSISLPCLTAKL